MHLHELQYTEGSKIRKYRKGRGIGSGNGKTAGKGHKGQNARSGGGVRPGFEGGQNPLFRRLPKFGFKNYNRKDYATVNLNQLNEFENGTEINSTVLLERGLIKKELSGLKILGNGEINKSLKIAATKFTKSAEAKILKAGGSIEVVK